MTDTAAATETIATAKGTSCRVLRFGPPDGPPVVFLHGPAGLLDTHEQNFLQALGDAGYSVSAPELPGYGQSTGEELLEDMLDFTLHGWDVVNALGIDRPTLIGHSMGGMIAGEMAAIAPERVAALVLVAPLGLWDDDHPVVDLFSLLPFQFATTLFADEAMGNALLTGGEHFDDMEALTEFFVSNARRLGTAGKILFPIPNRRVSKRLYRVTTPTLVVWGEADAYVEPLYADHWGGAIADAQVVSIAGSGHMVPYEQPEALSGEVLRFLRR